LANPTQKGEGNYEAGRKFNKDEKAFVQGHPDHVKKAAEAAKKAVDGAEKPALEAAERAGKSHAKGEDPMARRH
jgi:hypothetical protein